MKNPIKLLSLLFVTLLLGSCTHQDISGELEGLWQTNRDFKVVDGDGTLTSSEFIVFRNNDNAGTDGLFLQVFEGTVDLDKEMRENDVPFVVAVQGKWDLSDKDEIEFDYDTDSMIIEIGRGEIASALKTNGLLWVEGSLRGLTDLIRKSDRYSDSDISKITRYLKSTFKERFNGSEEEMYFVKIEDDQMTVVLKDNWLPKKLTFDFTKLEMPQIVEAVEETNYLPNYDWLSTRYADYGDIADKTSADIRIMRNYIFARHHYIFASEDLREYFSRYPWYEGYSSNVYGDLNEVEQANVTFLKNHE